MGNSVKLRMEGTFRKYKGAGVEDGLVKSNPWHFELIRE